MPYQPRPIPIRTQPPLATWQAIQFGYEYGLKMIGPEAALSGLNLPGLTELMFTSISIQPMVWTGMPRLQTLTIDSCDPIILDLTPLRGLRDCYAYYNMGLVGVDVRQLPLLETLSTYACPDLAWVDVADCPQLRAIYIYDGAMPQAAVDQLLEQLVETGATNGYCDVTSGTNAPPSVEGEAYRNILVARGWSVYTNGE